jgi:AP-1-like factor
MTATNGQFMSYLDSNQQDLLAVALDSNNNHDQHQPSSNIGQQFGNNQSQFSFDGMDPSLFMNTNNLAMPNFDGNFGSIEDSPFLEYADNDGSFDFDYNDADGQMIGSLPDEEQPEEDGHRSDMHDKRKSPEDEKEDNENGGKRREGEVKEAKKPGRKPLTSEPTNVSRSPPSYRVKGSLARDS